MLTSMEGERVEGSPKERTEIGHQKITRSKAEIQAAQNGPMRVESLVENLGKRGKKAKESSRIKVNGNPLYTETPANKTCGKDEDSGSRGKGKSNEFNPNSNTSNNKGQGGKKGGGGKSSGRRGRGKGVNAFETGEEWVDEGQVQDVQRNSEEAWQ